MRPSVRKPMTVGQPQRPPALPGFEKIRRYWDSKHEVYTARILPGEYYVSAANEVISTVLGSCVSACIRDRHTGVGGMNHFLLPEGDISTLSGRGCINSSTRYGSYAMEHMINDILANGGRRENLEVKLFGGGRVLSAMTDVGARNIHFVREYLHMEMLPVTSEDLGGIHPRKVLYFPASGRVLMRKMRSNDEGRIAQDELEYQRSLKKVPVAGEIDLF